MSPSTQITVPIFDGSDDTDAEDFIHSVRSKAFAEGKDTDHAWILRLVAVYLTGDALRWHANLKPEIQNDWVLFQKELLGRFCTPFRGIDGTECEKFIYSLRRRVFEEGRTEDNAWIAGFVGSSVAKGALRWYSELAPEIQMDPILLQKAMLDRYPPPEVRECQVNRPLIPMPASAIPASSDVKTGIIRFVDPSNPDTKYFLSRKFAPQGWIIRTENRLDALIVECDSYGVLSTIKTKNLGGEYDSLGIQWQHDAVPVLTSSSEHFARLVGLSGQKSSIQVEDRAAIGTTHANVWSIRYNNNIDVVWSDPNGGKATLVPRQYGEHLLLTGESSAEPSHYRPGSLIFEEI